MKSPKEGFEKSQKLASNFEETDPIKNGSINSLGIAKAIGLKVKFFNTKKEPGLIDISSFIDIKNKSISINQKNSLSEALFAVAIEIGQFLICPEYTISNKYKPIEAIEIFKPKSNIETKIAHDFALRLLIPSWSINTPKKASLTLDSASLMEVPKELIIQRIEQFAKTQSLLN